MSLTDEDRTALHAVPVIRKSDAPADEIVKYAQEENIDLIVMGTHGRPGLAHLLMGSVAEKVVRTAPCPVLTLRHPEREVVVARRSGRCPLVADLGEVIGRSSLADCRGRGSLAGRVGRM